MIMTPTKKLEKQEINALPLKTYDGKICVINTLQDVKPSCDLLQKENILGFDTETRPAFQKGEHYSPSIIQFAGEKSVLLMITVYGYYLEFFNQFLKLRKFFYFYRE